MKMKILCRNCNTDEVWQAHGRTNMKTSGLSYKDADTAVLEAAAIMRQQPEVEAVVVPAEEADRRVLLGW